MLDGKKNLVRLGVASSGDRHCRGNIDALLVAVSFRIDPRLELWREAADARGSEPAVLAVISLQQPA